ncbi:MAG: xanthine dehydrogenase small subunit [Candidatus Zeuxoniibacter abyssi]|nr:MAG: xanthine dehydrogenase small subunit [Candidatus Persebacteraceae bacterium AB1(2)]
MTVFYLNREKTPRDTAGLAMDVTVLEYLRGQGLSGTKEGCATGDCGACTVVVERLNTAGKPFYRGVNACLALLPAFHGARLITVEGLAQNGKLHPAQQSMVDMHGSQCGFCTPGFVMSLFALAKAGGASGDRKKAVRAISGNLCRCTGYRPIIDAALSLKKTDDGYGGQAMNKRLCGIASSLPIGGILPQSADELAGGLLKNPAAGIIAGAMDLSLEITQNLARVENAVFLGAAADMKQITKKRGGWHIGAGANWEDIDNTCGKELPAISKMLERFGSPQIRCQATVGGNIANASPVADGPPAFMALAAELTLRKGGARRKMLLENFFLGYKKTALRVGEFIESVFLPQPKPSSVYQIYKVSKRREDDISAVLLAIYATPAKGGKIGAICIAAGGMAAIPRRALKTELALIGKPWTADSFNKAAAMLSKDFSPISDMRASAAYRAQVAKNLLIGFGEETAG